MYGVYTCMCICIQVIQKEKENILGREMNVKKYEKFSTNMCFINKDKADMFDICLVLLYIKVFTKHHSIN